MGSQGGAGKGLSLLNEQKLEVQFLLFSGNYSAWIMTPALLDLHCLATAWQGLLKGCSGSTSEWLGHPHTFKAGVKHQLCKQLLGSGGEVKGPEQPADSDWICIPGFRYSKCSDS